MSPGEASGPGAELLRSWLAGDDTAFETLFRRYYAGLCAFASEFVNAPDVAEEVVQDVFMNLWRTRGRLRIRTTIRAYLYAAVRNRSLNVRRRAVEIPFHSAPGATAAIDVSADPAADLEARERAALVSRAVERLPPRCREVIRLRWGHGLSHAEIAESLGISRKAVERNVTRGLRALRESFPGPPA